MPRIINAIIAVHVTATNRKPGLATPVATAGGLEIGSRVGVRLFGHPVLRRDLGTKPSFW